MNIAIVDRLRCMAQTMQDVVVPGIDRDNAKAAEEAQFVLYQLQLILEQNDHEFHIELAELRQFADLVEKMLLCAAVAQSDALRVDASGLLQEAAPLRALALTARVQVRSVSRQLREISDALLKAALEQGDPGTRRQAIDLVMAASATQLTRDRVWAKSAGLDFSADTLPPLAAVL